MVNPPHTHDHDVSDGEERIEASSGDYELFCGDCDESVTDEGDPKPKRNRLNHERDAEVLANIHRIKTGHDPQVRYVGSGGGE